MTIQSLNRVDVTRYPIGHMIYSWLCSHGYRVKIYGDRLFLVRQL